MEPLKPEHKQAALRAAPSPDAAELMEEYERLLSERFAEDPDAPAAPRGPGVTGFVDREERLKELHAMLFRSTSESEQGAES